MSGKIIIVAEPDGRERHYAANSWDVRPEGYLDVIGADGPLKVSVARHAPGAWQSVRDADALVPHATARALGIARQALRQIAQACADECVPDVLIRIARDAEGEIAETEG
jgi:ribosomal protein S14